MAALIAAAPPGTPQRLVRDLARDALARLEPSRHRNPDDRQAQLVLPVPLDAVVEGCPLGARITVATCIGRQVEGDRPEVIPDRDRELSRHDGKRGRSIEEGACRSNLCATGRRVREDREAVGDLAQPRQRCSRRAADFLRR